jgi:GAF domain-containing protein
MPIDTQYPICAAMRNAKSIWIASLNLAAAEYPLLVPVWQRGMSKAIAAIPLVRDGAVIGAAGWSFHQPRQFAERERATFTAIAESVAGRVEVPPESATQARA